MDMDCMEKFLSEDYGEFIYDTYIPERIQELDDDFCHLHLAYNLQVVSVPLNRVPPLGINRDYAYKNIPSLFGVMDASAMEDAGIIKIQNQPVLELKGQGVIIGFVDTGIDYMHPAFRFSNGRTKIISIWDMTVQGGRVPEGMPFGSEYLSDEIQQAIESDDPYSIVPSRDEEGHGTFLAGIAAGSENAAQDFVGAAPMSQIVMVKVRQAKKYVRDFYRVAEEAQAYSEVDLLLALQYLRSVVIREQKPMVICFGMGTNMGDHAGNSPLGMYLNAWASVPGIAVAIGTGNEGDKRHHFRGMGVNEGEYQDVELRVDQGERGFLLELWGRVPETYSIGLVSPAGENIPRIPARIGGEQRINFVFENTVVDISYVFGEIGSGNEVIIMRFTDPTPGIWTIKVYGNNIVGNGYHIWLPITEFLSGDTYFIEPDPEVTLTIPSDTISPISVSGYNHRTGGFLMESGRGYPLNGQIKPDFAAPGANVLGPLTGGGYGTKSGTSVSVAVAAGACALFLTWGIVLGNDYRMNTLDMKNYLIQGAVRDKDSTYPMRTFGWGKLNVYNAFEAIRKL